MVWRGGREEVEEEAGLAGTFRCHRKAVNVCREGSTKVHLCLKKIALPVLWLSWDSQLEGNLLPPSEN